MFFKFLVFGNEFLKIATLNKFHSKEDNMFILETIIHLNQVFVLVGEHDFTFEFGELDYIVVDKQGLSDCFNSVELSGSR